MRSFIYTTGTSSQKALGRVAPELHERIKPPHSPLLRERATDDAGRLRETAVDLAAEVAAVAEPLRANANAARGAYLQQLRRGSGGPNAPSEGGDEGSQVASGLNQLGVEAESLVRMQCRDNPDVDGLKVDDRLLLLTTDTVAGVAAGCTVALQLGRMPRLGVLTPDGMNEKSSLRPLDGWPAAEVLVLESLAAINAGAVEHAAGALARGLLEASGSLTVQPSDTVIAEFSGGYKVTVPLAVHLLEYLAAFHRRDERFPDDVQLWFRHEYAADLFHRVSLRGLDEDSIEEDKQELRVVVGGRSPSLSHLDGFAYRALANGELELTPLGRALWVLFRELS